VKSDFVIENEVKSPVVLEAAANIRELIFGLWKRRQNLERFFWMPLARMLALIRKEGRIRQRRDSQSRLELRSHNHADDR